MPVYDFSHHADRLEYALSLPSKDHRRVFLERVRKKYGAKARMHIIEAMRDIAKRDQDPKRP